MTTTSDRDQLEAAVEHGYADSDGVRIHFAALGSGPLLVLIHGFPDFWYTWRYQMPALAREHRVVAMDLRGYNLSDQPPGPQNYAMPHLLADVRAVIEHQGSATGATVIGHDWGGAIAWQLAMAHPEQVRRLVVLNMPHPAAFFRELATNPDQHASGEYARGFLDEQTHLRLRAEDLVGWLPVQGPERDRHLHALRQSSIQAMLHYYQRNYPRPPYPQAPPRPPSLEVPVLMIHGMRDPAILPGGLNDTWNWVAAPLTILTLPQAGHFVHLDAAEHVTTVLLSWLRATATST